ncbi:MAG: DUF488 domain-containing protein [Geminicoccaceae bacterium]|nr:DUF488 domain-containing protein [Geminicoccaceae bacterium]
MRRIAIKRIFDPASPDDGFRVLVDRVWPRGVSKKEAAIDHWAKDVAPSTGLRKWFNHDPERWEEFQRRYREELEDREAGLDALVKKAGDGPMTLLFAAKDTERNQAVVLRDRLNAP